jgi:hypothetical protein
MATQADYTAVANALLKFMLMEEQQLPGWERAFIPQAKIPAAAGACAKVAVDALDAYRATLNQQT